MAVRLRKLRAFEQELRDFAEREVPERHLQFQRRIALELLRRIVFKTPVDTGRARGNWQVNLGGSDGSVRDTFDTAGGSTISIGSATIAGARPFGVITIFNNVQYIGFLEDGSSQQAPAGMVAVSLAEVESAFRRGR